MQKGRGRSSPSINLQAEAELNSRTHGRSQGQRCEPVLTLLGEWVSGVCFCLPKPLPLVTCSSGFSPVWSSRWGARPAKTTGQRGKEVNTPWSLLYEAEEACSVCPSSCLWLALSILPPCPPHPEAHWDPRKTDAAARLQVFLGVEERDKRCCLTPVLPKLQLTMQSSVER